MTKDHAGLVTDAVVETALHARVPGGAEVMAWLPTEDGFVPHQTARNVMRAALEAALPALLSQVRADALEEAAKVADQDAKTSPIARSIANQIRSLSATRKGSGG